MIRDYHDVLVILRELGSHPRRLAIATDKVPFVKILRIFSIRTDSCLFVVTLAVSLFHTVRHGQSPLGSV